MTDGARQHLRLLTTPDLAHSVGRAAGRSAGRAANRSAAHPAGRSLAADPAPFHPARGLRRRAVLYIGGEPEGRIVFTRMARRWQSVKVLVAQTGRAGLQVAVDRRLGMVVMHAVLPDVDAADLVAALRVRAATPAAPVVVVAHDGTSRERARLLWAGANAYVSTPLNAAEIEAAVGMLLESAAVR